MSNVHDISGAHRTSRVLQSPGGKQSLSLSWDPDEGTGTTTTNKRAAVVGGAFAAVKLELYEGLASCNDEGAIDTTCGGP